MMVVGDMWRWRADYALALLVQIGTMATWAQDEFASEVAWRLGTPAEVSQLVSLLEQTDGPVLVDEYMALLPLLVREMAYQPFEIKQLVNAGLWDKSPFVQAIHDQAFPLIMIYRPLRFDNADFWVWDRWTEAVLHEIDRSYPLDTVLADAEVYRPRP